MENLRERANSLTEAIAEEVGSSTMEMIEELIDTELAIQSLVNKEQK